jgi:CubicO group peptidase (beta-lactamase class C family)
MLRRTLAFVALSIAARLTPASAQAPDTSTRARVDRIFAAYDRTDSPGCAVGVYRDGRGVMARGYGMANLELNVALSPQSVFDIGSTSKQFTATSVVLLAQQGKLSLDDDIRKFIPELPNYGKTITVRHILTHTSGIRDYLTLWSLAGVDDADLTTEDDALQLIVHQRELNFLPGEQWLYSNSGFFLASVIVRRVSGKSLAQFAEENIFRPLGMTHTRYNDDHMAVIPNRATGYAPRPGGGFATAMSNFEQTGDGGVQTSIEDLIKWDENFYHPTVGGQALLGALQTVAVLNDGKKQTYALGLTVDGYRGLRTVSHGGSWAGYRAELMRFPDQHFSVATLCNLANTNPTLLSRRVADVFLGDKMTASAEVAAAGGPGRQQPPPSTWSPSPADLAAFGGMYYSPELETTYSLRVENGKLMLTRRREAPAELTPTASDSFRSRGLVFAFTREKGRPNGFTVDAGRTKNLRFERTK